MFDNSNWNYEGFPRHVALYMADVYMTIIKFLIFFSLGVGLCFGIGSSYMNLISVTSVFISLISTPMVILSEERKFWSNLTAVSTGVMTGPLFILAFLTDPSIIILSITGGITIFCCFTFCAFTMNLRKMFYFGSILSSILLTFALFSTMNILFFGYLTFYWWHIYLSLILFSFYVMFDTRIMIERASAYLDYEDNKKKYELQVITDSVNIFFDIINLLVKLIVLLLRDKKKR